LYNHNITILVDTRLKPSSQLSGFARGVDLPYFLENLIQCDYQHALLMSPTDELLSRYREEKDWEQYERAFVSLLYERDVINTIQKDWWAAHKICLLCSEHEPEHCHRRLVAEYIASYWSDVEIHHLI